MRETEDRWVRKDGRAASVLYREIWAVVCRIPRGKVATYGQVAEIAGRPRQPRLVGYALRALPENAGVPWHRVVNAAGAVSRRSGGPSGYEETFQHALLKQEGIRFDSHGRLDLEECRWRPRIRSGQARRGSPGAPPRGRARGEGRSCPDWSGPFRSRPS
jgi:methylated-DNA-protein-cysteine methyltransferase related protein